MTAERTREPQYQCCVEFWEQRGLTPLGVLTSYYWDYDPRRLVIMMSRYKFVAKMLSCKHHVLEIGCGDGFGARVVLQEANSVTAVDFDPLLVRDANDRMDKKWTYECRVHDILSGPVPPATFDAAYSLDVLEHIPFEREDDYMGNIARSLTPHGVCIIGSPSLESQAHASPPSRLGHVNCKTGTSLRHLVERYFHNVFVFSMNDEVVHTGFYPMAHYLFAVGCGRIMKS